MFSEGRFDDNCQTFRRDSRGACIPKSVTNPPLTDGASLSRTTKAFVADERIGFVGSFNFDPSAG
jgi:phosphatidylserine/phosphatidylglycerophosphate/cardiolipin synthase-like enzyme